MKPPLSLKKAVAIIFPLSLSVVLLFQINRWKNIIMLRNSYLLESLPDNSDWVWDALSGTGKSVELQEDSGDKVTSNISSNSWYHQNYHKAVLMPGLPSLTVHYIWCTDGYFELGHYLSILSVVQQLQPDKIVIHYRLAPRTDPQGYWRWLEDLQRNVIMLSMRPMTDFSKCRHDFAWHLVPDLNDFPDPYGVFLLGDVVVSNLSRSIVKDMMIGTFSHGNSAQGKTTSFDVTEDGLVRSQVFLLATTEPYQISESSGRIVLRCSPMTALDRVKSAMGYPCIEINSVITPNQLYKMNSHFFRFARSIMYGSPEQISPHISPSVQIPNIVHIVFIDQIPDLTPLQYVSIKSAFLMGNADHVFVHAPTPPAGPLWDRLHSRDQMSVRYIPSLRIDQLNTKHATLAYGLYTLLQHGGILHFGDVIFLQEVPSSVRHASAIAITNYSAYRLKHPSTNTNILAGAPGSHFIETFLAMLHQEDQQWSQTRADDVATHVREIRPDTVLMDSKLTVHQVCGNGRCQVGAGNPLGSAYTTRMIWNTSAPTTLDQLRQISCPIKKKIIEIVEALANTHQAGEFITHPQVSN